jgi:hypothetical protein
LEQAPGAEPGEREQVLEWEPGEPEQVLEWEPGKLEQASGLALGELKPERVFESGVSQEWDQDQVWYQLGVLVPESQPGALCLRLDPLSLKGGGLCGPTTAVGLFHRFPFLMG